MKTEGLFLALSRSSYLEKEKEMIREQDTICAIATGMGNAGIGIIRLSGEEAIDIADRIFIGRKKISEMKSYTASYGHVVNGKGSSEILDEVIVLVLRAPHTFTTENTVEFDCHGGIYVMKKIMDALIREGARVAEPGEFTKRAFLGGRIDMSEAEAVMDVISAQNDMALKSSLTQLRGGLKEKISDMRERILYQTAFIESAIDDPENYSLDGYGDALSEKVRELLSEIGHLLETAEDGRLIREGIRTAIVGKPNAGKSSVLNMLLGEERAIVTDVRGTTRDTLEETVRLNGVVLNLIDTAGIRETEDVVEKIGVEKARKNIEEADLILFVVDGSEEITGEDREIASLLAGKRVITLVNKNDLTGMLSDEDLRKRLSEMVPGDDNSIISISAKTTDGKKVLEERICELFFRGAVGYNDELYITNERHKEALVLAERSLKKVEESIEMGVGEDFYTIDLMAAYEALGLIIGETLEDDLADKIFREFCMGK